MSHHRRQRPFRFPAAPAIAACLLLLVGGGALVARASSEAAQPPAAVQRSTQPTLERQVETPSAQAAGQQQQAAPATPVHKAEPAPANQLSKQTAANVAAAVAAKAKQNTPSAKKSSLASAQNYDKYQLKATNSYSSNPAPSATATASAASAPPAEPAKEQEVKAERPAESGAAGAAHKKSGAQLAANAAKPKQSSFSLLKRLLPAFMTSAAGPMAAAAAAAASAVADSKSQHSQHSRSSQATLPTDGLLGKASGKLVHLLSGAGKKMGPAESSAPFMNARKTSIDRQGGLASSLLSNPLSLGLLFSAPLIPSLLLTPLAIAGLSPAMSAINNFFGDDDEPAASSSAPSGPLAAMLSGSSSPLSSFLAQASGSSPSGSASGEQQTPSFALQAVQSLLGPPATTEKPLFNPGLFASQGIQSAAAPLAAAAGSAASAPANANQSPIRNFLAGASGGGGLMQAAASMISPSFAAPPAQSSAAAAAAAAADSDDGPSGLMQVASDVFDKVASYMGAADSNKDLAQASSSPAGSVSGPGGANNLSPLSTLVGLSNFSPFQLSSLFAASPLASAISPAASPSSSSGAASTSGGQPAQKAGFFSTLRNVYELFSSSFLRRQEVGDSNECQQRLICELHQRAMNSKLFRRSLQSNLAELANLDRNLQEQIKSNPIQARIDNETKQMLNDFLKATNNFRAGRELVNCSKMYPKCSRAMLLSAANAHLADPVNGKAIGKFSNLMKKMKYKSAQQHQSQWKLRKPTRATASIQIPQEPRVVAMPGGAIAQLPPSDYLQVASMSPINGKSPAGAQLTPADSLKLVQQIMLMSQTVNQPYSAANGNSNNNNNQQQQQFRQQQQVAGYPIAAYGNQQQQYNGNNQQPQQQQQQSQAPATYTDAIAPPVYSSTDSPYYLPQQHQLAPVSSGQQNNMPPEMSPQQQQQQQAQMQQQQPAMQNYQPLGYPTSMMPMEVPVANEKRPQQQQVSKQVAIAAA